MATDARTVTDLPVVTTLQANDKVFVLSNNGSNCSLISIANLFAGLPNTDPHANGQVWNNAGVVTISTG